MEGIPLFHVFIGSLTAFAYVWLMFYVVGLCVKPCKNNVVGEEKSSWPPIWTLWEVSCVLRLLAFLWMQHSGSHLWIHSSLPLQQNVWLAGANGILLLVDFFFSVWPLRRKAMTYWLCLFLPHHYTDVHETPEHCIFYSTCSPFAFKISQMMRTQIVHTPTHAQIWQKMARSCRLQVLQTLMPVLMEFCMLRLCEQNRDCKRKMRIVRQNEPSRSHRSLALCYS